MKKYVAEMLGTMILVLVGCGAAISLGVIGNVGVAFAFGLSIIAVAYTLGTISGAHLNPAVTFGFLLSKRIEVKESIFYILFQIIGAIMGAILLSLIFGTESGLGINMVQPGVEQGQGIAFEIVFTCLFVFVILMVTSKVEYEKIAGIVIGLTLTGVHLVGIPITGTSVNPARSIGPALVTMDPIALSELWIFIFMPLIGAAIAALIFKLFITEEK